MPKLPVFATDQEAAEWFATHSISMQAEGGERQESGVFSRLVALTESFGRCSSLRPPGNAFEAVKVLVKRGNRRYVLPLHLGNA